MNNKTEIRWIHISDLHIGSPANEWSDTTLRRKLEDLLNKYTKYDFVIITGDLIHQGHFELQQNITELKNLLDMLKQHSDHLLVSLGNHDYIRNEARLSLLKSWQQQGEDEKNKQEEEYEVKLRGDFAKVSLLCKELGIENATECLTTSVYSGIDGINVVIFNTSTFCGQPKLSSTNDMV